MKKTWSRTWEALEANLPEVTTDLAPLEVSSGCGTPRLDSLEMKHLDMSEAVYLKKPKHQSCCEKIRAENLNSEKHI